MPPGVIGPYEIRAPLGHGGGGEVFRAWDPRLEREVALKILHARFESDPERVKSFVAEARAASALNHPNIVTVFDAAVEGGTPFIVSELIDGRALREELNRGPIPLKRVLDLATQIADGLAAAHDAHILHGDLKPENIMVTRTGRAKLVDFGLTRATGFGTATSVPAADTPHTVTEHGLVAGTVPYMSPERARGLPADFRSDQFSFGLVLYEMATGRRAFQRETPAATLDAIVNEEVPSLQTLETRAPVQLRWIIERCLAKDPHERYSATADLHRDLRTLRDRLTEAFPVVTGRAPGQSRRRWMLPAAGVMLLAAGAAAALVFREPAPPDLSAIRFMPFVTDPGYQGFPAVSPNGQVVAYSADVNGILQIFTRKIGSSESFQVTHEQYDCKHPFWSHEGQRIYYVTLAGRKDGIYAVSATIGGPQLVVQNATRGAISPDGLTIAFLRDESSADVVGTLGLWVATPGGLAPWPYQQVEATARKHEGFEGQQFIEGTLAFSPDGHRLGVCVVPDPRVPESVWQFWIVPLTGGHAYRRLESWPEPAPRLSSFTWLPDSRHLLLGASSLVTPGSQLFIADLDRDRVWAVTTAPDSQSYPSASANGGQIVFTEGEPDYDLVRISIDQGLQPFLETTRNESDAEVSRDGKQLVYVTDRAGQDEIWLRSLDGRVPDHAVVTQADFADADKTMMLGAPSFSPTGDRVAFLRNGLAPRFLLRVWISTLKASLRTPLQPPTYVAMQGPPTWSPDGQWIAYPEWKDKRWSLVKKRVDGEGKEEPIVIRTDGVANALPHWSPNKDWITWETDRGFLLVSPDGSNERLLSRDSDIWSDTPWLVHAWSHDGRAIFGIKLSDDRRLKLVRTQLDGTTRELKDLGFSPPVNNPVKGFSVSADGRTFTTSLARVSGDLWILKGLDWQAKPWWRR